MLKNPVIRFILLLVLFAAILLASSCQKPDDTDEMLNNGNNGNNNGNIELTQNVTNTGADINTANAIFNPFVNDLFLPFGFDSLSANDFWANGGGLVENGVEERGGTTSINGIDINRFDGWPFGDFQQTTTTMTKQLPNGTFVDTFQNAPTLLYYDDQTNSSTKCRWSVFIDSLHIPGIPFQASEKPGWSTSWIFKRNPLTANVMQDGYAWHPRNTSLFPGFLPTSTSYPDNNATTKLWNLMDPSLAAMWFATWASNWTIPINGTMDMSGIPCYQLNKAPVKQQWRDHATGRTYIVVPVAGQGNGDETIAFASQDPGGWAKRPYFWVIGKTIFQLPDVYVSSSAVQRIVLGYGVTYSSAGDPNGFNSSCRHQ